MWNSGLRRELEGLRKRVDELEDAYDRVTALEADWQDWLHKIRNVLARLNQRDRSDAPAAPPQAPINPAAARLLGIHFPNGGTE